MTKTKYYDCSTCRHYPEENESGMVQWPCGPGHTARFYMYGKGWNKYGLYKRQCVDFEAAELEFEVWK